MARPLNLRVSNSLITTSINTKGEKTAQTTSYAVSRTNDRPGINGSHDNAEDYIGPAGRARPMKQYRKRLTPNQPVISSRPTLLDIETPGSIVNRNDSTFLTEKYEGFQHHILPYSNKLLINRNCATYFSNT